MSASDWSPDDLEVLSEICLSIYGYHNDASEDLKPLLIKFRSLGRQLHSLSEVLKRQDVLVNSIMIQNWRRTFTMP
jgi:hypothetical protein